MLPFWLADLPCNISILLASIVVFLECFVCRKDCHNSQRNFLKKSSIEVGGRFSFLGKRLLRHCSGSTFVAVTMAPRPSLLSNGQTVSPTVLAVPESRRQGRNGPNGSFLGRAVVSMRYTRSAVEPRFVFGGPKTAQFPESPEAREIWMCFVVVHKKNCVLCDATFLLLSFVSMQHVFISICWTQHRIPCHSPSHTMQHSTYFQHLQMCLTFLQGVFIRQMVVAPPLTALSVNG